MRALLWLESSGAPTIGIAVGVSGVALLVVLGPALAGKPWLIVALLIYAANMAVAIVVQRPGLRRLLGSSSSRVARDDRRWVSGAQRQRYVSYLMAGGAGAIGFLMSTKPNL